MCSHFFILINLGPINENFKSLNFGFIFIKIFFKSEISDLVNGENFLLLCTL